MAVSQYSFGLVYTFVLAGLVTVFFSQAHGSGFSVEMFHRDSQESPFYNPLETRSERLSSAFRRSMNRARRFNPVSPSVSLSSAEATVTPNSGEYLMNISVGSPPFPISAIVDTGSSLTWLQCEPCEHCYKQTDPIFNPRNSTTYHEIPCKSTTCVELHKATCNSTLACKYSIEYGDNSFSKGVLGLDTVTLGSTSGPVALTNTIIGCGFNNQGIFVEDGAGIVGLGGGRLSLVTQMGCSINGKFSYCLVPYGSPKPSKLHFGDGAEVTGETAVSAPLFDGDPPTIFSNWYILKLEAISVGNKRLKLEKNWKPYGSSDANIIIDSGTTLTLLPPKLYSKFESSVAEQIELKRVEDPRKQFSLCYESLPEGTKIPKITVHFHGADVELTEMNTFLEISNNLVCFAFAPNDDVTIYGNVAQANFLVGYDSVKKTITFKPTDCTKNN